MPRNTPFLAGALQLWQPERGYRFSLDAPLLAEFIQCRPGARMLEIGCGTGIISLILFRKKKCGPVVAVELQEELASLARENVLRNGAAGQIEVICGDIRQLGAPPLPPAVDIIFTNPPYRPVGAGLLNPDPRKAAARHELFLNLQELMQIAGERLTPDGDLYLIHLAGRETAVRQAAAGQGLHLRTRRAVHSSPRHPEPQLILFHFSRQPLPVHDLPPFFIYGKEGVHSAEFHRIISP